MSKRTTLFIFIAAAALSGGCGRSAKTPASLTGAQSTPVVQSAADKAIETEIVASAPIAGVVTATGKILVPEDRTAVIGPVNEGRIVRLYAGQGSRVRKGQKLADLESLTSIRPKPTTSKRWPMPKTRAARRQQKSNWHRKPTIGPRVSTKDNRAGKKPSICRARSRTCQSNCRKQCASTKATLTAARRHLLILGLSDSAIDALSKKPGLGATFSLNAPIDGVVIERNATIGATVGTDASVFKIIDISRVWVDANVSRRTCRACVSARASSSP
jgi:cobalt-zinc-cadmium efflux system membrane fusion protein